MRPTRHDNVSEQKLSYQLKSFFRLWPYLWPKDRPGYRLRTLIAFILTIVSQFVLVGAPFLLGQAQDNATLALNAGRQWGEAWLFIGLFIIGYGLLRFLAILVSEAREYFFTPVGQNAQRSVATATFAHLHKLSLRYHLEKRTGGLSRVIERGIRSIDFLFRFLLFNIGPTLLLLGIAAIAFGLAYDWRFAAIAVVTVILYVWFTIITTEWRLGFRRDMNKKDTEANAKAIDSLLNYETVKYFNAENFETGRYDSAMEGYQKAAIKSRTSLATVNIGQSFIMNAGLVAMMMLAVANILVGKMSSGDILAISLVMLQVYRPLNILGFAYREIKQALTDMEKMFALLDIEPEVKDKINAKGIGDKINGAIHFNNVSFHYESNRPILKNISFTIRPGQTVAVVGPTGAGKSTLSRILYRFYDIQSGQVSIDDTDIRDVTQDSLRRAIGIVPQDTVLFNDTIGYNISYANPRASQDEIVTAAKAAQIHEFVAGLPEGYDTMVGERGLKLSGGEKQRVAIARTLLKNPAILILDEATSALDSVTEASIQDALDNASKNRTTLVIAHRLSTIVNADKIIVMDNGRIRETGTHEQLVKSNGLYAELWHQQDELQSTR